VSRDSFTREQAKAILAAQLSDAERLKFATEVIQNDQGFAELKTQVADLVRRWFA
jgi:dephospho-CoA kinase